MQPAVTPEVTFCQTQPHGFSSIFSRAFHLSLSTRLHNLTVSVSEEAPVPSWTKRVPDYRQHGHDGPADPPWFSEAL